MTYPTALNDSRRRMFFAACVTCIPCSTIAKYRLLFALLVPAVLLAQRSAAPVSQWETQLGKQPDNIDLRANLIREYFRLSRQDPGAEIARVGHVLWMVAHRPEASVLGEPVVTVSRPGEDYDALKKAWLVQADMPGVTPQVLAHAANFFRPLEPSRSIELLAKARSLEPKNWMWTSMLGEMYVFQITGVTGLNQNGFPVGVDPNKADSRQAKEIKAVLLASKDAELVAAVAAALQARGAIAASMTGRQAETAALAEELLERGQSLEPRNPKWHGMEAQFYAHQAEQATGERRTTYVRKAMDEFTAQAAIDPTAVSAFPPSYARIAVEAGELDKAQTSADRCLAQIAAIPFKDAAIHECNLILGRVALRRGELKRADEYLLAAAHVEGKGSLSSFGPNMMLARELLEKGQRGVVLEYFQLCGKFWSYDPRGQLARWTEQVKAGEIPQFGANLVY
jgi:hypothetical protein